MFARESSLTSRSADSAKFVATLLSVSCVACAPAAAAGTSVPPPPVPYLEFFTPTFSTYSVSSRCQSSNLHMEWKYDGEDSVVTSFVFNGEGAKKMEIETLNKDLSSFNSEVLARISCGNEGAEIAFIEADKPTEAGKQITYNWVDGRFLEVMRYNF